MEQPNSRPSTPPTHHITMPANPRPPTTSRSHPSKRLKPSTSTISSLPHPDKSTLDIPVEILLTIIEQIGWNPLTIGAFILTSKGNKDVVLKHEASLCRSFAGVVGYEERAVLSSAPTGGSDSYIRRLESAITSPRIATPLSPYTFPWVSEIHLRRKIKETLMAGALLACSHHDPRTRAIYHTAQPLCHHCSESINPFKIRGIDILYQMWDARLPAASSSSSSTSDAESKERCAETCQAPKECEARNNVEAWIRKQSEEALACVLQIVWIASQLYTPPPPASRRVTARCEHGGHYPVTSLNTTVPTSVPPLTPSSEERTREWETVERQCIFRELCFEAGPWFMYCARPLPSPPTAKDINDVQWAQDRLEMGISRLHTYESGAPLESEEDEAASNHDSSTGERDTTHTVPAMPRMTLQATLLNRFCEIRGCELRFGWDEVFYVCAVEIVEVQRGIDEEREREERVRQLERRRMREREGRSGEGERLLGEKGEGVVMMRQEFGELAEGVEKVLDGEGREVEGQGVDVVEG